MQPILSILICTMPERAPLLEALVRSLNAQMESLFLGKRCEILTDGDIHLSVGAKRNRLMARARGEFLCFIDDDDRVSADYLELILDQLTRPFPVDAVGIVGIVTFENRGAMVFRESRDYPFDQNKPNLHERMLNHLCPTRTELAKKFPFDEINCFEDSRRAERMVGRFGRCAQIEVPIYLYDYRAARSLTQGKNARK